MSVRQIRVPESAMAQAVLDASSPDVPCGRAIVLPVKVDWPELRLTEEQVTANAFARAFGKPAPFPDLSIFLVELPIIVVSAK